VNPVTVGFSPRALDDVKQAVDYYESQQPGLGNRFSAQLQISLQAIKRNPFFAAVRYDQVRCTQIKKFPYLVHYYIDTSQSFAYIIAVYPTLKLPR